MSEDIRKQMENMTQEQVERIIRRMSSELEESHRTLQAWQKDCAEKFDEVPEIPALRHIDEGLEREQVAYRNGRAGDRSNT